MEKLETLTLSSLLPYSLLPYSPLPYSPPLYSPPLYSLLLHSRVPAHRPQPTLSPIHFFSRAERDTSFLPADFLDWRWF